LTRIVEAARSARVDYRVLPAMLIRVGGLPYVCEAQLDDKVIGPALTALGELEAKLETHSEALLDSLPEAIHDAYANLDMRRALLDLKRCVYNRRHIPARCMNHVQASLTAATLHHLECWMDVRTQISALGERADRELALWLGDGRRQLRDIVRTPMFSHGLLASSPSFARALDRYVTWDGKRIDKGLRNTELALLSYLFRTTRKTSPLSTLTTVSLGVLDDSAEATHIPELASHGLQVSVQPNLSILARFRYTLTRHASRYPSLRLRLKAGASIRGSRIEYGRRVEKLTDISGPVHAITTDYAFSIALNDALESLFHSLDGTTLRVSQIVATLVNEHGLSLEEATQFIDRLTDNGLLVVDGFEWSVLQDDPWQRFALTLQESDDPVLHSIAASLSQLVQWTHDYAKSNLATRQNAISLLRSRLDDALTSIDATCRTPLPLFYEDASLSAEPRSISRSTWSAHLNDLAELHRGLALFDPLLLSKLTVKSIFKSRYGENGVCHNLVELATQFEDLFYRSFVSHMDSANEGDPFRKRSLNFCRIPGAEAIESAQAAFLAEILASAKIRGAIDNGAVDEVEISQASLEQLAANAASVHEFASNSFFFQYADIGGEPRVVLNHVYGGTGCAYGRFGQLWDRDNQSPLRSILELRFPGPDLQNHLFAEFQGIYETNLNRHRLTTAYELLSPGESSSVDTPYQIPLETVSVRHNAITDTLYLYSEILGRRIIPVYSGMFYPLALQGVQAFLLHFASPTLLRHDLLPKFGATDADVTRSPRVRYQTVIVERARWTCRTGSIPTRASGETDFAFAARLASWRTKAGVPRRCFAQVIHESATTKDSEEENPFVEDGDGVTLLRMKPFFVDFENAMSIYVIEKQLAKMEGFVHFTELLPTENDSAVTCDGEKHVSEFVCEITQCWG
jgi:hypothetical protein